MLPRFLQYHFKVKCSYVDPLKVSERLGKGTKPSLFTVKPEEVKVPGKRLPFLDLNITPRQQTRQPV